MKALQLLFMVCMCSGAFAQDTAICIPGKPVQLPAITPGKWQFITNVPADLLQITKSPFKRSNLKGAALLVASTALLLPFDQKILDGVKHVSEQIHLQAQTDYKVLVKSGDTKIIKLPRNINSALYQLGEGGTSMLISGGLFIYGKINKDNRALQTASDIAETFITMGITTQVLKRISGRQSPGILGYSLIGLTGWAMINTDVHWMADYPLALALGYISGKITCLRHKKAIQASTSYR